MQPIEIGAKCNIQDGVIIQTLGGTHITIGRQTSLAHGCIIHGLCTLGQECFVGFKAVVYNATLEDGVFISAGTVVQWVDLVEKAFVPAVIAVLSREDVVRLASTTCFTDRKFMRHLLFKIYNCIGNKL